MRQFDLTFVTTHMHDVIWEPNRCGMDLIVTELPPVVGFSVAGSIFVVNQTGDFLLQKSYQASDTVLLDAKVDGSLRRFTQIGNSILIWPSVSSTGATMNSSVTGNICVQTEDMDLSYRIYLQENAPVYVTASSPEVQSCTGTGHVLSSIYIDEVNALPFGLCKYERFGNSVLTGSSVRQITMNKSTGANGHLIMGTSTVDLMHGVLIDFSSSIYFSSTMPSSILYSLIEPVTADVVTGSTVNWGSIKTEYDLSVSAVVTGLAGGSEKMFAAGNSRIYMAGDVDSRICVLRKLRDMDDQTLRQFDTLSLDEVDFIML